MATFLPEDLLFFQILARLPMKFLLRLTLVCKRWHFFITNPGSIQFHIAHASYNSSSFLLQLYTDTIESHFTVGNKDENNVLIKRINDSISTTCKQIFSFYDSITEHSDFYLIYPENAVTVIGSAHGLICFRSNFESLYFIWNPMTKMLKTVSPSPESSEEIHFSRSRFCYDQFDRDFKIIKIQSYKMRLELGRVLFGVKVYSCKLDNWRETRYDSLPYSNFHIAEHVKDRLYVEFLPEPKGSLVHLSEAKALVAFDIHGEVFEWLPCPKHTIERAKYGSYINWKDCLGIVVDTDSDDLNNPGVPFGAQDVYTFDEISSTWIKQYNAPDFLSSYRIFFGLENGDMVVDQRLSVEVGDFKLFEAQSKQFRNLTNAAGMGVDVMRYTESLVCINGMQQL